MSTTKHVFIYTPYLEGNIWGAKSTHDVETHSNSLSGVHVVEIEFRGCSLGSVVVDVVIPPGSFVVFKPDITTQGLPPSVNPRDIMDRCIYFTINGINNAAFVYSPCDTYPSNLDDKIPTVQEVKDPKIRKDIPSLDAFLEHLGVTKEEIQNAGRDKQYFVW